MSFRDFWRSITTFGKTNPRPAEGQKPKPSEEKTEVTPPAKVVEGGNIMYTPPESEGYKGSEKPAPLQYPHSQGGEGERNV